MSDVSESARHISRIQLLAAAYLVSIGTLVLGILPALVGALASAGTLRADQAGQTMACDLAAQVFGNIAYVIGSQRLSARIWIGFGLLLMALGNGLSCGSLSFVALIAARIVAGFGVGIVLAASYAFLGLARSPARIAGLAAVGQTLAMVSALWVAPLLSNQVGWYGPFLLLALVALVSLLCLPLWPNTSISRAAKRGISISSRAALCLVAACLYYLGQVSAWAFAERIGVSAGLSSETINLALAVAIVPGLAGSLMDFFIGRRISVVTVITASLAMTLASLFLLSQHLSALRYGLAAGMFYFAWCVTYPFLFAATVRADPDGDAAGALAAAMGLGIALGPAVAGDLFVRGGANTLLRFDAICASVAVALIVLSERSGKAVPIEHATSSGRRIR